MFKKSRECRRRIALRKSFISTDEQHDREIKDLMLSDQWLTIWDMIKRIGSCQLILKTI